MTTLINPANFEFFARYLLSGLIIIWVRSAYVTAERPKLAEMIVEAVIFSLFTQLVVLVLSEALFLFGLTKFTLPDRLLFLVEVLVVPATLGLLFGLSLSKGWNHAFLRRLSMPIQNPNRRAYDFAFLQNDSEGFVILTFEDGTKVYGYYGENSLAANDPDRSDIYLERLYNVDEAGQWSETSPPRGALLRLAGLRSIEFLDQEGK